MRSNLLVRARVRRMGNSLGVVIPQDEARRNALSEGDTIEIEVRRKLNIDDLFGSWKTIKSARQLKDEARLGWNDR